MNQRTCKLCLDDHKRDDTLCTTCRRFANWWATLSPEECRQHERAIIEHVSLLEPRTRPAASDFTTTTRYRTLARLS
jgi:hypothetical protein